MINLIKKSRVDSQGLSKPLRNCRVREECSVGGKCNSENVVYKATIFPIENRKDIKYTLEFLLEIGSRGL